MKNIGAGLFLLVCMLVCMAIAAVCMPTVVYADSTTLKKPANLQWDGTTAKWDPVTGAARHRVILNAGTSSITTNYTVISNEDITTTCKDFWGICFRGMYYQFQVAAFPNFTGEDGFSGFSYSTTKQVDGSIGTVTGFVWDGKKVTCNAVSDATGYDVWVMKDGSQAGYVRNITDMSFDLTSDITDKGAGSYYLEVKA